MEICAPFTDCIREINNTQINKAKDQDVVMPMYNLIEYCELCNYVNILIWTACWYSISESFRSKRKQLEKLLLLVIQGMLK